MHEAKKAGTVWKKNIRLLMTYHCKDFWDQYYHDLIDDASYEDDTNDVFAEQKLSQLHTYQKQQVATGSIVPFPTQRLETTVGYLGRGRYDWMQSFDSLRPVFQKEIEPLMPGYTMPPRVLAQARAEALAARQEEAGLPAASSSPTASKENVEPIYIDDPVLVSPDVRVLQVGCGTSNMGEEMFAAGWPNVLNIDFSQVCITLCEEQWNQVHWEEVQAKIENDLKEETEKERIMLASWEQRRADVENSKATFATDEKKRIDNKNIKRKQQLVDFITKTTTKINEEKKVMNEAESSFNMWKNAQPEGGEVAPGVLSPEAREKHAKEVEQVVKESEAKLKKWTEKIQTLEKKSADTIANSYVELKKSIEDHVENEAARVQEAERSEKEAFKQWQQDRRDYHTKGEGLLKGLRYSGKVHIFYFFNCFLFYCRRETHTLFVYLSVLVLFSS